MKKQISQDQAIARLQRLCSISEKCTCDLRKKLSDYKIGKQEAEQIILKLQKSGFVDDERFAGAFAKTKHNLSKWGVLKIKRQLELKQIPNETIKKAIAEIDSDKYAENVSEQIRKKMKTIRAKSKKEMFAKLLRFAVSRGYEYDLSFEIIIDAIKAEFDELE